MELSKIVKDIRTNWAVSDAQRDAGLTTPEDIERHDDISYGPYGRENLLDIYHRKEGGTISPTIVNIHGGGWVYGSKELYQFYCMSLAQKGFTVVNINYRLAPENRFPAALTDINAALCFLAEKGSDYRVDTDRIILVGDSAGGQLVSHYAAILTNPVFAAKFGFTLPDIRVRAVGLNCGKYDGRAAAESGKDEVFLEYLDGVGREIPEEIKDMVDTMRYITPQFPPAYIMSAQNDFLMEDAEPMYLHLKKLGVPCRMKIYGTKEQKEIAHVFHLNCRLEEAALCNEEECGFFREYVKF